MKKIILFINMLYTKSKFLLLFAFYTLPILCTLPYALCPSDSLAAVRFVSHSGSNTPPYLTWETAADSIMSAINISSFGDTIYVANGVYEEQVVMIPGLSLIGAGMDSCIINFQFTGIPAIQFVDSCSLKGFKIIVPNSLNTWGISVTGYSGFISSNKIINPSLGIYADGSNAAIYENILENIKSRGIWVFNSNSIIKNNEFSTDPNSDAAIVAGIYIGAYDYTYQPIIDSNIIYAQRREYGPPTYGIYKSFGAKPFIKNNIILTGPYFVYGIFLSYSDSINIVNNLIWGPGYGIDNEGVQYLRVYNNYIGGGRK